MASTPIVGKQPQAITIHLTYNADGTVTSNPPSPVKLKKGNLVAFVSDKGYDVYVKLNPTAYKPSAFTPQSGLVTVLTDSSGRASLAQCGFVKTVNGEKVAYGWLPDDVRSGIKPKNLAAIKSGIEMEP